jgi:hypothetical protein
MKKKEANLISNDVKKAEKSELIQVVLKTLVALTTKRTWISIIFHFLVLEKIKG